MLSCKYCGSTAVVKFGKYKGVQRYYCKVCRRKITNNNCLFHMKKPLEYVGTVLDLYFKGMTVFEIIKLFKYKYNYLPSRSLMYKWIEKFTDLAEKYVQDYFPVSSDTWIINATILTAGARKKVYLYDIMDEDTHYLLSSRIFAKRNNNISKAFQEAVKRTGHSPRTIIICKYCNMVNEIKRFCKQKSIYLQKTVYRNTDLEDRFTIIFNGNILSGRPFKTLKTLIRYNRGWTIYYNYLKPNRYLGKQTPAEIALINTGIRKWHDLLLRLELLHSS